MEAVVPLIWRVPGKGAAWCKSFQFPLRLFNSNDISTTEARSRHLVKQVSLVGHLKIPSHSFQSHRVWPVSKRKHAIITYYISRRASVSLKKSKRKWALGLGSFLWEELIQLHYLFRKVSIKQEPGSQSKTRSRLRGNMLTLLNNSCVPSEQTSSWSVLLTLWGG